MRVWRQFVVVVVVKLSPRWDEEAGVAHPRTRWQPRYSNRPVEERHCCYWEVNLIYYCSCFQRNHIYYPHCGVVNFVSLYLMNQTLELGFRPKEYTNCKMCVIYTVKIRLKIMEISNGDYLIQSITYGSR